MALGWLRRRWPTRTASRTFVVIAALCALVTFLDLGSREIGPLEVTACAMLRCYAAALHGTPLVAVVWGTSATALLALGWHLAHVDVVLLVRSIIVVGTVNVLGAAMGRVSRRLILANHLPGGCHPPTGMLSPAGFWTRASALLDANPRDDGRHLVLAVADIDGYSLVTSLSGDAARLAPRSTLCARCAPSWARTPSWAAGRTPRS